MPDLDPLKFAVEIQDNASATLKSIKQQLDNLKDVKIKIDIDGKGHNVTAQVEKVVEQAIEKTKKESSAIKESTTSKKANAEATSKLKNEVDGLTQSINFGTQAMRNQIGVLSDLKSMATQYLGVWGEQQFIRNIIETGGQLEMQRLSIGAILQSQSQANTLFNQIKGLALQSPFGVVQLDQMSKQLSAYGFKYADLFDMTNRLADISAATGTSVDRLALALGHVRSEAALSGYTLRMFSQGNIPLLEKLSEKLHKTSKEIRDMVRKKEVSYQDVVDVLKDLTNEGGMFHNMQEVISQSVKAKFKNVRDAMDIMYGEMAEGGVGEALKKVADLLMTFAKNWEKVMAAVMSGATVWAAAKTYTYLYNQELGKSNAATLKSIISSSRRRTENIRLAASYRGLSQAERERVTVAHRGIVSDGAAALSKKKLTVETLTQAVAFGKITKEEAKAIVYNSTLEASTKGVATAMVEETMVLSRGQRAWILFSNGVERAIKTVGAALKSLQLWFSVGIMSVVEVIFHYTQQLEKASDLADNTFQKMTDGIAKVKDIMKNTDITFNVKGKNNIESFGDKTGTIETPKVEGLSTEEMQEYVDIWTEFIREYSATPNLMLKAAYATDENGNAVMNLAQRYEELSKQFKIVAQSIPLIGEMGGNLAIAMKDATSLGSDSLVEDIKDYDDAYSEYLMKVSEGINEYKKETAAALKAARAHKEFAAALQKAQIPAANLQKQIAFLSEHEAAFPAAAGSFIATLRRTPDLQGIAGNEDDAENNIREWFFGRGSIEHAREMLEEEFKQVAVKLQKIVKSEGKDPMKLSPEEQQAVIQSYSDVLAQSGAKLKETKKKIMELIPQYFKVTIDIEEAADTSTKTSAIKKELDSLTGDKDRKFSIDIGTTTDFFEVIDKIQKAYKEAKERINNSPKIMLKIGVDMQLSELAKLTHEQISKLAGGDPVKMMVLETMKRAMNVVNDAQAASKKYGFKLEEPKDKSGNKSSKKYEDPEVKKWRERVKNIREAYSEYAKIEKKFGDTAAIAAVKDTFHGIIDEETLNNIKNYRQYVEDFLEKAKKRYEAQKGDKSKEYGKQANSLMTDLQKLLLNINLDEIERSSEKWASRLGLQLDEITRKWELFKEVREATGSAQAAMQILGMQGEDSIRNAADNIKEQIMAEFGELGISVPLDINLDDEEIKENLKAALGSTEYKDRIEGLVNAIKKWRDAERGVIKDGISGWAQIEASAVDYKSKINRIYAKAAQQKEAIDKAMQNGLSRAEGERAKRRVDAIAGDEAWKEEYRYLKLMNYSLTMTRDELEDGVNTAIKHLNNLMKAGVIEASKYAEEMSKLRNLQDDWNNNTFFGKKNNFTTFLKGGLSGLISDLEKRMEEHRAAIASADKEGDEYAKANAVLALNKDSKTLESLKKLQRNLGDVSIVAAVVTGAFDVLQKATRSLSEMFDALGKEGVANFWSDVSDAIGGVSSIFAPAGNLISSALSGDIGGIVSNAISAPIQSIAGPITAFSQLHDKRIERQIEKIRENIEKIEANTKLIQQARERTLGWDTGQLRRSYAQQYAPDATLAAEYKKWYQEQIRQGKTMLGYDKNKAQGYSSGAQRSMYEYYSQNSLGTGYSQELRNLKEEREEYLKMLDKQQSKKKKSNAEIEATKAKVAELDDQIRYFTLDLAKELFSIDIKGWADQLSDALMSAFENGESRAKAYRDTVREILQSVASEMQKKLFLEKMFQKLKDQINDVFDEEDIVGSAARSIDVIAKFFGPNGEGDQLMTASAAYLEALNAQLQKQGLPSLKNESSNTLSSNIQGTSEETSTLLAGYVNALRQDVSANRIMLSEFVASQWPDYMEAFANHTRTVVSIDSNVRVMMEMMRDGRGAMYDQLAAMRSRIDNVVNGVESFAMK